MSGDGWGSNRRRTLPLFVLLCLLTSSPVVAEPLRIEFLDVGQGDSALITTPSGKTVLIDGGPAEGAARVVARLLGRKPIDLVLLTHRHADHLAALPAVVEKPGARIYIDPPFEHRSPIYAQLVRQLAEFHVEVRNAVAGRKIDLGDGAMLTLLGPPEPQILGTRSDVNANSVVSRLDYRHFSVLFMGDSEAETESWLLRSGGALRARVIKVAHHGSRYSSTPALVAAVHAEVAVISAGSHNDYGHPHTEAMLRWTQTGARIYRTDLDGDVTVSSDGDSLEVSTRKSPPSPELFEASPRTRRMHERNITSSSPTTIAPPRLPGSAPASAPYPYLASSRSSAFHRSGCLGAAAIVAHNLIGFSSREDAIATGRHPAGDCHP